MASDDRPHAVVDAQLDESSVRLAVRDDGDGHLESPIDPVEVEDELLEAANLCDHVVDRVERHVVLLEE